MLSALSRFRSTSYSMYVLAMASTMSWASTALLSLQRRKMVLAFWSRMLTLIWRAYWFTNVFWLLNRKYTEASGSISALERTSSNQIVQRKCGVVMRSLSAKVCVTGCAPTLYEMVTFPGTLNSTKMGRSRTSGASTSTFSTRKKLPV